MSEGFFFCTPEDVGEGMLCQEHLYLYRYTPTLIACETCDDARYIPSPYSWPANYQDEDTPEFIAFYKHVWNANSYGKPQES